MENFQSTVVEKRKKYYRSQKRLSTLGCCVLLMDSLFSILVCEGFVSFTFDWAYTEKLTFSLNYFDLHAIICKWISYNQAIFPIYYNLISNQTIGSMQLFLMNNNYYEIS